MNEMDERLEMLEELVQGFVKRMTIVETEMPKFLKDFLQQYQKTLNDISTRIELSNKRYDDQKIMQIDEVNKLMKTMPKVIDIKNHHHFGAWSKSLIIGVLICFCLSTTSIGTALFLNHKNNQMNSEAFNYWLVRALYPKVSKTIEVMLKDNADALIQQAEKEMEKQQAVLAAKAKVEQINRKQKDAEDNLEKAKSGK